MKTSPVPSFHTTFRLDYPQAVIKFGRAKVREACANKKESVDKERGDLLRALFCKRNSNSGRTTKYDESEHRDPKPGPLTRKIESTKLTIGQERIGEAFERLAIFQKRLDSEVSHAG